MTDQTNKWMVSVVFLNVSVFNDYRQCNKPLYFGIKTIFTVRDTEEGDFRSFHGPASTNHHGLACFEVPVWLVELASKSLGYQIECPTSVRFHWYLAAEC